MNTLSWIIYFAGIAGNITGVLIMLAIACAGFFVLGLMLYFGAADAYSYARDEKSDKRDEDYRKLGGKLVRSIPFVFTLIVITASIIPPRDTIIMIAASQAGEYIIQLEEVQEIGGELTGLTLDTIKTLRNMMQEKENENN